MAKKTNFLLRKIPGYFRAKYQLIATVTFTTLFSLVFVLVSVPFSHNVWFEIGPSETFSFTAAFFILCVFIIIFSKRLMYATRKSDMNFLQYGAWCLSECLLISLIYTIFTILGNAYGIIHMENLKTLPLFLNAFGHTIVSIIIPYIIAGMYFVIIDMNNTIRLVNYNNVVSDEQVVREKEQKVTLFDNSGVLKLSVSLSNLYYIESDDNYIIVWYTDNKGELQRYMIRCRLKTVEESFKDSSLVRCHRKYIVNMEKVKVLRKEKDGYELDLGNNNIPPIPITKTYAENVLGRFNPEKNITQKS